MQKSPIAREQRRAASPICDVNAAWLEAFATHLAGRAANTREAYLRDTGVLAGRFCRVRRPVGPNGAAGPPFSGPRSTAAGFPAAVWHARMLSSWRALYRFLQGRDRAIKEDPCAGIKAPKSPKHLPSALSPDEAVQLVTMSLEGTLGVRDRAVLELAYSSGLRLSELAGVDVDRIDLANGEVRVWGKGAKERIVPVGAAAQDAIRAWLEVRAAIPGVDCAALFVGRSGRRIHPRAIQRQLALWAAKCGLPRHVHPHMLRHSFASHVLQSSGDLRAVQEMLGHASIASTQVYTHLDFQYLAAAYDKAHPRAKKRPAK